MRILIVDEHPGMARSMARALRSLGHHPVVAPDPFEALRMVSQGVEAVISEIALPQMSGVELARVIHRRHPGLPLAFFTAEVDDEEVVGAARNVGRLIPKPWSRDDLAAVVTELSTVARAA